MGSLEKFTISDLLFHHAFPHHHTYSFGISMLSIITCLVYTFLVFFKALLVYLALFPPKSRSKIVISIVLVIGTAVMEFPLIFIGIKVAMLWWVIVSRAFVLPLTIGVLWIDLITIAVLFHVFFVGYKSREIVHQQTREFSLCGPKLPSIYSPYFWLRIMAPIYVPFGVDLHRDIVYATPEELAQLDEKDGKYLKLDIYKGKTVKPLDNRPVLVFIHGGAWAYGDKIIPYPQPLYLASHGWIVISINYRLHSYPNHIIDAKRALRWIRENVSKYGGSKDFICVAGDSSGGQMAAVLALTPNDPKYQPGFENVDTRVQACVTINGALDVANSHGVSNPALPDWFAKSICRLEKGFSEDSESRRLVEEASSELLAIKRGEKHEAVPPFFVFHGDLDNLVPVGVSRHFVRSFRHYVPYSKIIYIEYPGGHHGYHMLSAPKTHYQMIGMLRFLNWVYVNQEKRRVTFKM